MEELERIIPTSVDNAIEILKEGKYSLDIKNISLADKIEIIKFALNYENLDSDPLMLLNILNLVKSYNTLSEDYFQSPDIYVNSVEELLDLKLALSTEMKTFSKKIVMYFFGILKSFNKMSFTAADEHEELPNLFKNLFLLLDINTISALLAKCPNFCTDEIKYVDNAYVYMSSIILKSAGASALLEDFYKSMEVTA